MKYEQPFISAMKSIQDLFVRTQASGNNGIAPSNPSANCNTYDCDSQGNDVSLNVQWNDDAGSDVNGYVVTININGDVFNVKDENAVGGSNTCNITESPAGIYTLSCSELQLDGAGCDNCDTYDIISITDGFGNTLPVNGGVSCNIDEC